MTEEQNEEKIYFYNHGDRLCVGTIKRDKIDKRLYVVKNFLFTEKKSLFDFWYFPVIITIVFFISLLIGMVIEHYSIW